MHCLNVDVQTNFELVQACKMVEHPNQSQPNQVSDWMNKKMACFIINTGLVGSLGL